MLLSMQMYNQNFWVTLLSKDIICTTLHSKENVSLALRSKGVAVATVAAVNSWVEAAQQAPSAYLQRRTQMKLK